MNIAVIFAGGVGTRMKEGNMPKQFLQINNKAIIIHTIEVFERSKNIDKIVVVCVKEYVDYLKNLIEEANIKKVECVLEGGETALGSQYIGLKMARKIDEEAIVLLHDGVRPLIEEDLIEKCIDCVKEKGSCVTVSKATETIVVEKEEGEIYDYLERKNCFYARAPQCFYVKDILEAHQKAIKKGDYEYVDSATMMLSQGKKVYTIVSPCENIKVTTISDYYSCQAIINKKEEIIKEQN